MIPFLSNFLSLGLCLEIFLWVLEVLGVMWWKLLQQRVYSAHTVLLATVLSTGPTRWQAKRRHGRHPHGIYRLLPGIPHKLGHPTLASFSELKPKYSQVILIQIIHQTLRTICVRNGTRPREGPSRENGFGMASVSCEGQWESMRPTWHKSDKRGRFGTPTLFHVGMPLQPPAFRNRLARTTLRFGRKSTTLDSGDSYYSSEWLYGTAKKKKKKNTLHLLLDSYSGAQGWLLHVFCILQQDQVPSSQTKNLKLTNISCHGQCWMRYRHIHVWNSIWEMPERVEDSDLHQRPGLYCTWFKFRWDRQLTLPDVHCFILSEIHCEGSFCAMICHFVNGWAWISCTVRWCVEVSHITNMWSDSPSHRAYLLSYLQYCVSFKCTT